MASRFRSGKDAAGSVGQSARFPPPAPRSRAEEVVEVPGWFWALEAVRAGCRGLLTPGGQFMILQASLAVPLIASR